MSKEEILAAFDTPVQIKYNALQKENRILEAKIKTNNRRMTILLGQLYMEQDKVADELDKKDQHWRMVLVNTLKKNK